MPKRRAVIYGLLAIAVLVVAAGLLRHKAVSCPQPATSLPALLEYVPCPAAGNATYDLHDDRGVSMAVLDPIADPAGGYLGVYHALVQPWSPAGGIYEVLLAHSKDLIHWHELVVLDDRSAAMPTLRAIPGAPGFLLADEKADGPVGGHVVRIVYYRDRAALVRGRAARAVDLPLRYSQLNNGTPSFRSIRWRHGPAGSTLELAFHYQLAGSGIDREAVGTLQGFGRWRAYRDAGLDRRLDALGLAGSHGDQRGFSFGGREWRVYEASAARSGFGDWRIALSRTADDPPLVLRFHTAAGTFRASFGNPIVSLLPAPDGRGRVLVMTLFVFSQGPAAREAGELLFYRRV